MTPTEKQIRCSTVAHVDYKHLLKFPSSMDSKYRRMVITIHARGWYTVPAQEAKLIARSFELEACGVLPDVEEMVRRARSEQYARIVGRARRA